MQIDAYLFSLLRLSLTPTPIFLIHYLAFALLRWPSRDRKHQPTQRCLGLTSSGECEKRKAVGMSHMEKANFGTEHDFVCVCPGLHSA